MKEKTPVEVDVIRHLSSELKGKLSYMHKTYSTIKSSVEALTYNSQMLIAKYEALQKKYDRLYEETE